MAAERVAEESQALEHATLNNRKRENAFDEVGRDDQGAEFYDGCQSNDDCYYDCCDTRCKSENVLMRCKSMYESYILYNRALWHWWRFHECLMRSYKRQKEYLLCHEQCWGRSKRSGWLHGKIERSRQLMSHESDCADCSKCNCSKTKGIGRCETKTASKCCRCHETDHQSNRESLGMHLQCWNYENVGYDHDNNVCANSDSEGSNFQMELNEDFKKFLEISHKHRRERDESHLKDHSGMKKRKKMDRGNKEEEDDSDVQYFDVSKKLCIPTKNAPTFVDKMAEYKDEYGKFGERILCMEARMQLHFDRFCDKQKPSYWPCIPLKF